MDTYKGEEVENICATLDSMSLVSSSSKEFSIAFTYPFLMYNYMDRRQKKITIDLCVPSLPSENFNVKFNEYGAEILVYTKLPDFFTMTSRITMNNDKLNDNSSKVVAFEECVTRLGVETDHEVNLYGPPQRIKLPFKCDVKIPIEP